MAERGIDQNEEKKSYSSIFVIGNRLAGGVLALGVLGRQHYPSSVESFPIPVLSARLHKSAGGL